MSQRRKTMNHVTVTMYWAFRYVLFLASILTCSVLPAAQHKKGEQPNILFLFADDLTYEAIRAFGHTDIDTPNIDRLVGVARHLAMHTTWVLGVVQCVLQAAPC